ncbi:MAG: hypothetical protein ACEQSB_07300 [Undibacterium sp.]
MVVDGETRAKLNGAVRDALKKGKVPFIEVNTQSLEANVVIVTVVTGPENQDATNKLFAEVAKRQRGYEARLVFKTPETLAKEKSATLRTILEILTGSEPYTLTTMAERTNEPTWVVDACLRALSQKGVVKTLNNLTLLSSCTSRSPSSISSPFFCGLLVSLKEYLNNFRLPRPCLNLLRSKCG